MLSQTTVSGCVLPQKSWGKRVHRNAQTLRITDHIPTAQIKKSIPCAHPPIEYPRLYTVHPRSFPLPKKSEYIYYSVGCTHNPQDL
jgi:hypothetical protein